jgi:hypothetical protein
VAGAGTDDQVTLVAPIRRLCLSLGSLLSALDSLLRHLQFNAADVLLRFRDGVLLHSAVPPVALVVVRY